MLCHSMYFKIPHSVEIVCVSKIVRVIILYISILIAYKKYISSYLLSLPE